MNHKPMTKQEKTALFATATNFTLTVVKFFLASLSGSLALLADAYHSFADIGSSFLVYWAMRQDRLVLVPGHTPTQTLKTRLFREGAWEAKAALGIGIALLIAGLNILSRVRGSVPITLRYSLPVAIAFFFLAFISYLVYRFEVSVGEETDSPGLLADGNHARVDGLTTAFVGASLVFERLGWKVDRWTAAIIALIVLSTAVRVISCAIRSYLSNRAEKGAAEAIVFEDAFVNGIALFGYGLRSLTSRLLPRLPGYERDPEKALRRLGLTSLAVVLFVLVACYIASGFFVVQEGERAIVERFGQPSNPDTPLEAGLYYAWPWPVGRINRVDCRSIRAEVVGYQSLPGEEMILWTNVHYITPYTVITGENSFCEVAMALHYRIRPENLEDFLYLHAQPEEILFKLSHKILRESFGVREFFSTITTERNQLDDLIARDIQQQADAFKLGIEVLNVCLRDVHPSVNVAPAFEDVVSAMEDLETYIEMGRSYQKSLLARAQGERDVKVLTAQATSLSAVKKAEGEAEAFIQQSAAFKDSQGLTSFRLRMELLSQSLAPLEKYVISIKDKDSIPDLWTGMRMPPALSLMSSNQDISERNTRTSDSIQRITREEDVLELLREYQKEVYPR